MKQLKPYIATATNDDIDELVLLLAYLFSQESEFVPDANKQKNGLRQILENSIIGTIFVLKIDGITIGMVSLLYTISTALGGKVALLEDLVLAPEYRRLGFGKYLLEHAINFAKDHDCKRVTLLTDSGNSIAQRLYQSCGFSKSGMLPMRLVFKSD